MSLIYTALLIVARVVAAIMIINALGCLAFAVKGWISGRARDWRLLVHWIPWTLHEVGFVLLLIPGFILVVIASLAGRITLRPSVEYPGRAVPSWADGLMWIFGNEEDGVEYPGHTGAWWRILWFLRNPIRNLTYVRPFGFTPVPAEIRTLGNCATDPDVDGPLTGLRWSYVWQGLYSGFWLRWPGRFSFRYGWKLIPADAVSISQADGRYPGMPFALQPKLNDAA